MTTEQMIKFLRLNVNVQNDEGVTDSAYLSMSDEDILLYLNVVLTRDFPDTPSLDYLPTSGVFPLILLAKKELYYALAVANAPLFDLGADNNNYLKREQRFKHYMALIEQAEKEYQDYLDNGGGLSEGAGNTLTSFDVLLSNRYYTRRNYEKGAIPAPILYVDNVTQTYVEFHWKNAVRRFAWCNVYVSTKPNVDPYLVGQSKIVDKSTLVQHLTDARQVSMRVEGLDPNTDYYIAIELVDMSSLTGYFEQKVTTLAEDEPEGPDTPPVDPNTGEEKPPESGDGE